MTDLRDDEYMDLAVRDKAIVHALYLGVSRREIATKVGITLDALNTAIHRLAARNNCDSAQRLIIRYVQEYLGVGDPYPGCPWECYLQGKVISDGKNQLTGVVIPSVSAAAA